MKITLYGITKDGETFRPQNWPHRIACIFSPHEQNVCRYRKGISIGYTEDNVRYLSMTDPTTDCASYLRQFAKDHELKFEIEN